MQTALSEISGFVYATYKLLTERMVSIVLFALLVLGASYFFALTLCAYTIGLMLSRSVIAKTLWYKDIKFWLSVGMPIVGGVVFVVAAIFTFYLGKTFGVSELDSQTVEVANLFGSVFHSVAGGLLLNHLAMMYAAWSASPVQFKWEHIVNAFHSTLITEPKCRLPYVFCYSCTATAIAADVAYAAFIFNVAWAAFYIFKVDMPVKKRATKLVHVKAF